MLTVDLPLEENLKALIQKIEQDTLNMIVKGVDVRGQTHHAIKSGEIVGHVQEEELPGALAELGADHLLVLLVENNKGEDFKAGGTINIHVYSPKRSFEGYSDLYLNEDGVRVTSPMEWQFWEGSMGYFS
ncbi:TPA: hypothetical protein QDB51_003464 [Burkholderia vietnamiensis]|nr:hypothetical protein [Burkholderia vietnamiensis]